MGGEFKMWVNGEQQGSGPSIFWDTGGSHKFKVAGLECEMAVKLEGALISAYSQFYTYQMTVNGVPIECRGATESKPEEITKENLKAFYEKYDAKNVARVDEILSAYSADELATALKAKYVRQHQNKGFKDLCSTVVVVAAVIRYGETPAQMITEQELAEFYRKHDPSNVARVKHLNTHIY